MAYAVFIALHALAGVVGLVAASALVFVPRYADNRTLFSVYLWSLVALVAFLAAAMAAHWQDLGETERLTFSALFLLGPYMLYRANKARLFLSGKPQVQPHDYFDHIGFTLIALFEGFVIVSAIDLDAPGWLVAVIALLGIAAGRWAVGRAKTRVLVTQN